jgi:hypothetical protein
LNWHRISATCPEQVAASSDGANSLTEQCGHMTFQIFWVLGGLQANRTLLPVSPTGVAMSPRRDLAIEIASN